MNHDHPSHRPLPDAEPTAPFLLVEGDTLSVGDLVVRCAIGRGGTRRDKHEGDGATPVGLFPLRRILYRADRLPAIVSALPVEPLRPTDGWCDAPDDAHYNERVTLPYAGHHEELWRDDHVYDVIIVVGYNDAPAVPGKGSAIFMHLARAGFTATEGCVAVEPAALLEIARRCGPATMIDIRQSQAPESPGPIGRSPWRPSEDRPA